MPLDPAHCSHSQLSYTLMATSWQKPAECLGVRQVSVSSELGTVFLRLDSVFCLESFHYLSYCTCHPLSLSLCLLHSLTPSSLPPFPSYSYLLRNPLVASQGPGLDPQVLQATLTRLPTSACLSQMLWPVLSECIRHLLSTGPSHPSPAVI